MNFAECNGQLRRIADFHHCFQALSQGFTVNVIKDIVSCTTQIGCGSAEIVELKFIGKNSQKESFYGKTQKEVKDKAKAYQSAKAEGIEMDVVYTFEEWADMWFESHKDNIMPTTQENYKYTLRTLKSFFGRRKIRDIKPFDIEMMLKKLRHDGRSLHYLAQCRGMMYQIMHKAEANDLIRKNPVRFAEKMRNREPIKRKDAFTTEQVAILMEKLPEDRMGLSIRLMLGTGMRTQEILALEPRHIEPDGSVIRIEQAINMYKGTGVVGTPNWGRNWYRKYRVFNNPFIRCPGSKVGAFLIS